MIWVESSEVLAMFKEKALKTVSLHDNSGAFYAALEHEPAAPAGMDEEPLKIIMSEHVGCASIEDLGDSKYAIVLANYDRGNIKYDPAFAQDRWRLQVAADAAHQARVGAYFKFMLEFGVPDDFKSVQLMYDLGEDAVPDELRSDLAAQRRRVQEVEAVIMSLSQTSATDRGSAIGMSSQQAKAVAAATNASRELAVGRRSINGVDDPSRVRQFERLLAEQQDMTDRRVLDDHHPCRPDGYTIDEWKDWILSLHEGQQILTSARRKGKGSENDGKALAEWRAANPGTGWLHAVPPADALSVVLVETEFVPIDISAVACGDCGLVAAGSRSKAGKIMHDCKARGTTSSDDQHDIDQDDSDWDDTDQSDAPGADSGKPSPTRYLRRTLDEVIVNFAGVAAEHECFVDLVRPRSRRCPTRLHWRSASVDVAPVRASGCNPWPLRAPE